MIEGGRTVGFLPDAPDEIRASPKALHRIRRGFLKIVKYAGHDTTMDDNPFIKTGRLKPVLHGIVCGNFRVDRRGMIRKTSAHVDSPSSAKRIKK